MKRIPRPSGPIYSGFLAMLKHFTLAFMLLAAAIPARAERTIDVHDPWIRHMTGDRPMAGYLVIENRGREDRSLVGASSAAFGAVHIHETVEADGAMSMRPVESIAVPAGGRVELRPGGYHLMLMQKRNELEVGDEVAIILEFADGGSKSVVFAVKPAWQE
jgi:periplasmic copper chaperone A